MERIELYALKPHDFVEVPVYAFLRVQRVMLQLFKEERLSADQMRDLAQDLEIVLRAAEVVEDQEK